MSLHRVQGRIWLRVVGKLELRDQKEGCPQEYLEQEELTVPFARGQRRENTISVIQGVLPDTGLWGKVRDVSVHLSKQ